MFCATCGGVSPDTAPCCGNCGAPLVGKTDSSAASRAGASQQFQFAPIAHSPFSNEPLPQPSGSLPLVQPVGDILTFTPSPLLEQTLVVSPTPPPALAERALADYPTQTRVPVPTDNPVVPRPLRVRFDAGSSFIAYSDQAQARDAELPGNFDHYPAWEQQEGHAATLQASPVIQPPQTPVYPASGVDDWGPEESYEAIFQVPPLSQPRSDVSFDLANYTGSLQGATALFSGMLPALRRHPLVRPMPLWAGLPGAIVCALLLVALVFLSPDWATGALLAGTLAIILAVLLLIVGGVRVALGMLARNNPHRHAQMISSALLILLFVLIAGVGISQQSGLHSVQAHYLEGQHSWQMALNEYQAAGETAPASDILARVYNEWGEELSKQQQYGSAVIHFNTVLQHFGQARGQLGRARTGMLATYMAWGDFAARVQDYAGATSHYDTLLALDYCDPGCQSLAKQKDATAYYHLAEQQLSAQQFALAVNAFNALSTRFAGSPEAGQSHAPYAQALWGLGQQQLNTTCSAAVKTYQQLAQQFADTDRGKQAATALLQPVTVKGHFITNIPGAPFNPTVALVQGLFVGIQPYQFPPLLRAAPVAQIHSDGTFTFPLVPQGQYELVWSSDGILHFYYASNGDQVRYTANVGPLCTYNYGDIPETIPTT